MAELPETDIKNRLSDLTLLDRLPILLFDALHLIFQTEFKFLEPDFLDLFVVCEVALFGEQL
jgi:hypothetical protein